MSCNKTSLSVLALVVAMAGCGGGGSKANGGTAGTAGGTAGVGGSNLSTAGTGAGTTAGNTVGSTAGTTGGTGAGDGAGGAAGEVVAGGVDPVANADGSVDTLKAAFPAVTDWAGLEIVYPTSYSAFDGEHTFQLPMRVRCNTAVPVSAWHADPASAVSFDANNDKDGNPLGVMVTIVEPVKEIVIGVVDGTKGGIAPLHITIGRPEQWVLGDERYHTGSDWMIDMVNPLNTKAPPPDTKCVVCHTTNSSSGFNIEHSPTQAARISDEGLRQIMTTGTKPADVPFRVLPDMLTFGTMTLTNAELYSMFHLWEASEDQLKGMILYLRSIPPTGQGCVNNPLSGMCEDVEPASDPECDGAAGAGGAGTAG